MPDHPEPVQRFVHRQLGHRGYEAAASEPTTGFGESVTGRYRRSLISVTATPDDPRLAELARDDCYFQNSRRVEITWDIDTGDILRWTCDPAAREFGSRTLTDAEAIASIVRSVAVPSDHRVFRRAYPTRKFAAHLLTAEWGRVVEGVEVSGDYAEGVVNVTTGRIVSFSRGRWGPLPEFGAALPLPEARRIADSWAKERHADLKLAWNPSRRIGWDERRCRYVRTWDFTYERETGEIESPSPDPGSEPPLLECTSLPADAPAPRTKIEYASISVDDAGRGEAQYAP